MRYQTNDDYNDYRHEYDGYDDGPVDPLYEEELSNNRKK
jgi:hypothetical protein